MGSRFKFTTGVDAVCVISHGSMMKRAGRGLVYSETVNSRDLVPIAVKNCRRNPLWDAAQWVGGVGTNMDHQISRLIGSTGGRIMADDDVYFYHRAKLPPTSVQALCS